MSEVQGKGCGCKPILIWARNINVVQVEDLVSEATSGNTARLLSGLRVL